MLFVVFNIDRSDGAAEIRTQTRRAHLEFMKSLGGQVKAGGPLFSQDGQSAFGGMYILEADSQEQAAKIAARDPYVQANLFTRQYIQPWKWNTRRPDDVAVW
ncbi:hypothetical protein QMR30_004027 [Salmonella enterica]|nr:hypothetical protein [Salmonella enterica]ELJ4842938.1 hypothetical protein [Salmonella enterica]